jgi:hypothetical protein
MALLTGDPWHVTRGGPAGGPPSGAEPSAVATQDFQLQRPQEVSGMSYWRP